MQTNPLASGHHRAGARRLATAVAGAIVALALLAATSLATPPGRTGNVASQRYLRSDHSSGALLVATSNGSRACRSKLSLLGNIVLGSGIGKVRLGMPRRRVECLIGRPSHVGSRHSIGGVVVVAAQYQDGDLTVTYATSRPGSPVVVVATQGIGHTASTALVYVGLAEDQLKARLPGLICKYTDPLKPHATEQCVYGRPGHITHFGLFLDRTESPPVLKVIYISVSIV